MKTSTLLMGLANSFSGGLFLSAGIVHILPEANKHYTEYCLGEDTFPWPFFCATISFSFIL